MIRFFSTYSLILEEKRTEYKIFTGLSKKIKLATLVPFQLLQQWGVGEGATPFPGLLHFTLDPYNAEC